jgi:hypothetical protein
MTEDAYAEFRIEPTRDQFAVVQAVTAAIADARAQGKRRLLVDLRPSAGMLPPTLAQRDALVTTWARAAAGEVIVAVLTQADLLDPERFGELVAAAAGLRAEGFDDEQAARAWLSRQRDPHVRPAYSASTIDPSKPASSSEPT